MLELPDRNSPTAAKTIEKTAHDTTPGSETSPAAAGLGRRRGHAVLERLLAAAGQLAPTLERLAAGQLAPSTLERLAAGQLAPTPA